MDTQIKIGFEGLGTMWEVRIDNPVKGSEQSISKVIKQTVSDFEDKYSRFKVDSLISQLNRWKELKNPPQELLKMLAFAKKSYSLSNGAFDICLGSQLEAIGYDRHYTFKTTETKKPLSSSQHPKGFCLQIEAGSIKIPQGVKVDLGGMGKGWLIDKLVNKIKRYYKPSQILVNAGGDIRHYSADGRFVTAALENPVNPKQAIGKISFANSAIACSAPNRRRWVDPTTGQVFHHLLEKDSEVSDSRDKPKPKAAIFTHAKTALVADTLATTAFVAANNSSYQRFAQSYKASFLIVYQDFTLTRSKQYPAKVFTA